MNNSREVGLLLSFAMADKEYPLEKLAEELRDINWGGLIELSIRHKMLPTLSHHLCRHYAALTNKGLIKYHIANFFVRNHGLNIEKKKITLELSERIFNQFEKEGIPVVMNKGLVLDKQIHYGDGRRHLGSDIDFMIHPESRERTYDLLTELGFTEGRYDIAEGKIISHSRQNSLIYKFSPDHLIRFTTLTGGYTCQYMDIDFANNLSWHNSQFVIPVEDALENIETIEVEFSGRQYRIHKFNDFFEFIFVFMHLYREAWFYKRDINIEEDVNIKKFYDVVQYLKQRGESLLSEAFMNQLEKYNILMPFKWVVIHTDMVFGTDFSKNMDISDIDPSYLNSAFESQGKTTTWKGTMAERLFSENREGLFEK
jgi:hypothetical protein